MRSVSLAKIAGITPHILRNSQCEFIALLFNACTKAFYSPDPPLEPSTQSSPEFHDRGCYCDKVKESKSIHTLNARDNVMLEVMRDYFKLSPTQVRRVIHGLRHDIDAALEIKGIRYEGLKSALVPDRKRKEIALVFDSLKIDDVWYGMPIFRQFMPLFDPKSSHSVLVGDYLGMDEQDALFEAMQDAVHLVRATEFRHSTQFYIVYINNLTPAMFDRFARALSDYEPFVGFADMTFGNRFKWLLSTMLVNSFIKHRDIVLQGHPDDVANTEDENTSGYPYEEFGYVCRSVQSSLEGTLLSYKIERPVLSGFESDTAFALNAISDFPLPLEELTVEVEDAKARYLKSQKSGVLHEAGLLNADASAIARLIADRISGSYIYNLRYDEQNDAALFNIIVEMRKLGEAQPFRMLAAMQYKPESNALRLVTLY